MSVAVSTMILRGMRMTGEKTRGASLTSAEQTECLAEMNAMLDSWSLERLMCVQLLQESFSLTVNTVSYTIGPGATLSTAARPTKLVDPCFVRDSSNLDTPLKIIESAAYGTIVQKSTGTTYPEYIYYDQAFDSSGYGTLYIYPAPIASLTLFINSWKQISQFAHVSTQVSLPPGYQLAIESNYAIHSAAGLTSVSPEVAKIARESKANIKTMNIPETISRVESGVLQNYRGIAGSSILTGP